MSKTNGYIILVSNRFTLWAQEIARELKRTDPAARIWMPFLGTAAGYIDAKEKMAGLTDYVDLEWSQEVVFSEMNKPIADLEQRFQSIQEKLPPGALNRVVAGDRHFGHGFIKTVNQERSQLSDDITSLQDLKRLLVLLMEWNFKWFDELQPKAVFCYCVAGGASVGMWEIAQKRKIAFRVLDTSGLPGYHHIGRDPFLSYSHVSGNLKSFEPSKEEWDKAEKYLEEYRASPSNSDDWEVVAQPMIAQYSYYRIVRSLIKNILTFQRWDAKVQWLPGPFARIFNDSKKKLRAISHMKSCEVQKISELPKKFIYFPLHVDPEASTMVMSPLVQNQESLIENLARSIPFDTIILVKEHILTLGWRKESFYKELRRFPNVRFASR